MRTILMAAAMGLLLTSASMYAAGPDAAPYQSPRRPVILPMLYAGFAFLEGFDVHSTITALNDHAREANPVIKTIAKPH